MRYNVSRCMIDALPEQRKSYEFAKFTGANRYHTYVAYYDRNDMGHKRDREDGLNIYPMNRAQALGEIFAAFQDGLSELPRNARQLGGRFRDGLGEYHREMTALTRSQEKNAIGNMISRHSDGGKDDHYAHADTYCLQAMRIREPKMHTFS